MACMLTRNNGWSAPAPAPVMGVGAVAATAKRHRGEPPAWLADVPSRIAEHKITRLDYLPLRTYGQRS